MDQQLSASLCAVTTDAADTFITWPLIRPIADTDWVSVWCRSAWTDYAGLASCALLSLWPTTILGALNSGSAPAGRISPGRYRWELMSRGHIISVILSKAKNLGSNRTPPPVERDRYVSLRPTCKRHLRINS